MKKWHISKGKKKSEGGKIKKGTLYTRLLACAYVCLKNNSDEYLSVSKLNDHQVMVFTIL